MANLYHENKDYSLILQDIHNSMKKKMYNNTLKRNAKELQNILQEIKQ